METTSCPLTAQEKLVLARLASPRAQLRSDLLSAAVAFMLTFMLGVWITRWVSGPPRGATLVPPALAAALVAVALFAHARRTVGRVLQAESARHAADLAHGRATCTTLDVTDALRVEEHEDEGSAYYLQLAGGGVLFLSGQYLYEYEAGENEDGKPTPARFPCRRFRIERAARSGLLLELVPLGPAFPPSGTLPAFTSADHLAGAVPEDGARLEVEFESLRASRAS